MPDRAVRMNNGLSLLLVDDDAARCESLRRDLRARGFNVRIALSAREAAARAEESPPQLAVLGLKLTDGSGQKLISTLLGTDPRTRVVVVAGYGTIAGTVEAIKLGATHYLSAPTNGNGNGEAPRSEADAPESAASDNPMSLHRVAWEHIETVLRQHNGNISATARALSLHRRTLQRKLNKRLVRK
jgi:two-component system response regulator RegA